MERKIIECKVKVTETTSFEEKLLTYSPVFKGVDSQTDTYFNVLHGRLKLREGNIENALIQYNRANVAGTKLSDVLLYLHEPNPALKAILTLQFGVLVSVVKRRKIYFVDNVKFHFDEVQGLGSFIEIEAIDTPEGLGVEQLQQQCDDFINILGLPLTGMVAKSYSDLLLEQL